MTRFVLSLTAASGKPTMTVCGSPLPGLPTIALAAVGVDPTSLKLQWASFDLHGVGINAINRATMDFGKHISISLTAT